MEIPAAVMRAQRAEGPATVLAIGTATPDNFMYQADYPDYYFRVTKSEHLVDLKRKFKRMCDGTMIRKRYMHLTEEYIQENPNMAEFMAPSFNARRAILCDEIPKLAKKASERAIKEWGQPMSKISHLVFCTTTGVGMPSFDYQLVKLLGLNPSVKRVMLYMQGCFAGGTVLRAAKDLAENNHGARVLVVCAEMNAMYFRGPSAAHLDSLVGQALFGDGAAALIVGADPEVPMERPLFQVVSTSQTILPDTDGFIVGDLLDGGAHLTTQQRRASGHLEEYFECTGGLLRADGHHRLELHLLGGSPRRSGHPRHGGGSGLSRQEADESHPTRPLRVWQHVQRVRPLHPR
uniref:Uncharacterized protein n=1 Tax=Avena sativa TaxID=4498 RepID=A0ACD5Z1X9_AVESA